MGAPPEVQPRLIPKHNDGEARFDEVFPVFHGEHGVFEARIDFAALRNRKLILRRFVAKRQIALAAQTDSDRDIITILI